MIKVAYRFVLLALIVFVLPSSAIAAEDEQGFVILQKSELGLTGDRIKTVVLHGDPNKEGLYIIRILFPAGMSSRPHSHDQDRFVTVIDGTWYAGTQSKYDMDKTVAITVGGFMKHPAGAIHFDGAKDEDVVVEIRGMGPVKTTSANSSR